MLLRRIYIMSLEHPGNGFLGILAKEGNQPASLHDLNLYILGYSDCLQTLNDKSVFDDLVGFEVWMKANGIYGESSTKGWVSNIIEETGDGMPAFNRFKEILFEYLEAELPAWFIEFNSTEQPSPWWKVKIENGDYKNAKCIPATPDIRDTKHIQLASNSNS